MLAGGYDVGSKTSFLKTQYTRAYLQIDVNYLVKRENM